MADNTLRAWGRNNAGQLGNGTNTSSTVPVVVSGLDHISQVSGGWSHAIALRSTDGTVWTWGLNASGQLGDGTHTNRNVPIQVAGLTGMIAIAARDYHNLALESDGSVWAWGWNINGQLGDNTTIDRNIPVMVVPGRRRCFCRFCSDDSVLWVVNSTLQQYRYECQTNILDHLWSASAAGTAPNYFGLF